MKFLRRGIYESRSSEVKTLLSGCGDGGGPTYDKILFIYIVANKIYVSFSRAGSFQCIIFTTTRERAIWSKGVCGAELAFSYSQGRTSSHS